MTTAIRAMTQSTGDTMHQKTQYTFEQTEYHMKSATAAAKANTRKHRGRHQHQRTHSSEDADPSDGSGSLTYSAASSINSAGESTDSSFADIMKVLDMQDPSELGPLMKDKGMTPAEYHMHLQQHANYPAHHQHNKGRSSQVSVASSLQYSTDGESNFLHGAALVSTITGQPSDSTANDGGSYNAESDAFAMFAPAEYTDGIKKRKKEKRNSKSKEPKNPRASPRHGVESMHSLSSVNTSRQSGSTSATTRHKNSAAPPPIPRGRSKRVDTTIEDDICYAEWWMSCFPDAFKEMMPRR